MSKPIETEMLVPETESSRSVFIPRQLYLRQRLLSELTERDTDRDRERQKQRQRDSDRHADTHSLSLSEGAALQHLQHKVKKTKTQKWSCICILNDSSVILYNIANWVELQQICDLCS